jgi:hypothetical protein
MFSGLLKKHGFERVKSNLSYFEYSDTYLTIYINYSTGVRHTSGKKDFSYSIVENHAIIKTPEKDVIIADRQELKDFLEYYIRERNIDILLN